LILNATDFLDETLTTVQYSKCNNIISIIQALGEHAKIGKIDINSAFRPVPYYPGDFDLLGCIIGYMYFLRFEIGRNLKGPAILARVYSCSTLSYAAT
jgi:hypothetical protein